MNVDPKFSFVNGASITPSSGVTSSSVLSCSGLATDPDGGTPTIAYVRMATPDGAAEAERALRSDGLQLAKAGVTARVEVLRGERLERYTERIGDLRERTAHTRKLKRDAWWHRKYGAEGGGEESGAAEEEAGAEGDAAAPPPKRLRKEDENE